MMSGMILNLNGRIIILRLISLVIFSKND